MYFFSRGTSHVLKLLYWLNQPDNVPTVKLGTTSWKIGEIVERERERVYFLVIFKGQSWLIYRNRRVVLLYHRIKKNWREDRSIFKKFLNAKYKMIQELVIDSGCITAANFLWRHKHEMKLYPNDPINGKNSS